MMTKRQEALHLLGLVGEALHESGGQEMSQAALIVQTAQVEATMANTYALLDIADAIRDAGRQQ